MDKCDDLGMEKSPCDIGKHSRLCFGEAGEDVPSPIPGALHHLHLFPPGSVGGERGGLESSSGFYVLDRFFLGGLFILPRLLCSSVFRLSIPWH